MREVSKEEFFKVIGPKNVHPTILGNWPYTSDFRSPDGKSHGRIENRMKPNSGLTEAHYFLPE